MSVLSAPQAGNSKNKALAGLQLELGFLIFSFPVLDWNPFIWRALSPGSKVLCLL